MSNALFRSTSRIENCDAVIRVYDKAGNVIGTREQAGEFKSRKTFLLARRPVFGNMGR
jgi:hypothetical protein